MRNKKTKLFLIFVFIITCTLIGFKLKSQDIKVSNSIKKLEESLNNNLNTENSTCKDLFDFDYDKVYAFQPYLPKNDMEKEIGFKYWKLRETVSEGMMNILFIRDNEPVVYLYGYSEDEGYYIDIPMGEYNKSDLDNIKYSVKEMKVGNSYGNEKTYKEYIIHMKK